MDRVLGLGGFAGMQHEPQCKTVPERISYYGPTTSIGHAAGPYKRPSSTRTAPPPGTALAISFFASPRGFDAAEECGPTCVSAAGFGGRWAAFAALRKLPGKPPPFANVSSRREAI